MKDPEKDRPMPNLYEESVRIAREVADAIGSNIGYATIMGGLSEFEALIRAEFSRVYPKSECQADPVFLLQSRRWVCKNMDNYHWDEDAEALFSPGGVEVDDAYREECSEDWDDVWETEGVFFDRAEAQAWGDARSYRWGKHQTYAVSAKGDLAKILAPMTTYWDGQPYKRTER